MTSIMRWSPLLSRWPDIWDDEDLANMVPATGQNLEVAETKDKVVVKANVAGVPAEKIDLTFEKGVLFIQAQQEVEDKNEEKRYFSKMSSSYSYKVAVPGDIDHHQEPEAVIKDGIITVTFSKAEAAKPKKLTVKSA